MSPPRISLVIPAYNAEPFILKSLQRIRTQLEQYFKGQYEIILVDDGSTDGTSRTVAAYVRDEISSKVRIERLPSNSGKFSAIKCGVKVALGDIVAFTDADVPYSLSVLFEMVESIEEGNAVLAIGDRNLPSSEFPKHPQFLRRVATEVLSHIVGRSVTPGYFDTQCGIKACRADIGKELFNLVKDEGFSGDIELVFIAISYQLAIKKFPVHAEGRAPTTVRVFSDGIRMLYRIARLSWDRNQGYYESEVLKGFTLR